jgi:predicted DNA-binding transcriptional regulator YafY
MSKNKNALLRFQTLDKCFRNSAKKYYFEDLLVIVNEKLVEENPKSSGIQVRQLRDDIRFMKSEAGYAAPIEAFYDEKKAYYRYEDPQFSINNSPLNSTEAAQLKNAISVLQRFEGSPGFEWVSEMAPMLNSQFGLKNTTKKVMAFESNIDYLGYNFVTPLFNAIVNKQVLQLHYVPFNKEAFDLEFHPYFLKQYNNRWFIFGYNASLGVNYWNLALDRISELTPTNEEYREDDTNWGDFFEDMIGVTKPDGKVVEKVVLEFTVEQAPYIYSKPLHLSQVNKKLADGRLQITMHILVNYELEQLILSFGEKVKVLEPEGLKETIKQRSHRMIVQYS